MAKPIGGKRKSLCDDFISEPNENEIFVDETKCLEPDAKVLKTEIEVPKTMELGVNPEVEVMEDKSLEMNGSVVIGSIETDEKNNETQTDQLECLDSKDLSKNSEESIVGDSSNCGVDEENSRNLADTSCLDVKPSCICITFDEAIAEIYKMKFMKFIQTFVELEVESHDKTSITVKRDPIFNPMEWVVLDETTDLKELQIESLNAISPNMSTPSKKRKKKAKKAKELFVVDPNPSIEESKSPDTKYSSKFSLDNTGMAVIDSEIVPVSSQTCFNCNKNHSLKDCTEQKDYSKINAARQRFKTQAKPSRYHVEEDQKYSNFVPGKITTNLRDALGLRKNQLPPFIYNMRILGYPPGWLEEAKIVHSNLSVFGVDQSDVKETATKKLGLNQDKIIDYPGFNVPMEKGMKDEFRSRHTPPYSQQFNKQAMIDYFEKAIKNERENLESCDMDLDPTNGDCDEEVPVTEEVLVQTKVQQKLIINEPVRDSPSLVDLEHQKQELLAELNDAVSNNAKCDDQSNDEKPADDETSQHTEEKVLLDKPLFVDIKQSEDSSSSQVSPSLNSSRCSVKNSSFGTPILKSSSPYSQLPNPDNFSKNVSPIINFENLPNSTGKYERMTGVLQNVRNALKNLQNSKS